MRGISLVIAVSVLVALAGCGRGGARRGAPPTPPAPAVGTPVPPDSLVRVNPESLAVQPPPPPPPDSLRPPAESPAAEERPAQRCILDLENTPETRTQFIKDPVSGKYTSYFGGGVVGRCRRQDITIIADSAETYEQSQLYFLIGNVRYREVRLSLDADRLSYFRAEERLLAEGNVRTVMRDSSTMVGSRAEYFRAVAGIRDGSRIIATARPTLTMFDRDSLGAVRGEPVTLIADNIVGEGDSLFTAWGRVELDRSDLLARGDSLSLDNARQASRLMKGPFIESKGDDPFTLRGRVIDLYGQTRAVERVVAKDSGVAVNKDLTLASDTIDLRVRDNKLQRAFAFGAGGASAVTHERTILADSLDVWIPDQRIRELHAVRNAYAETDPDTAKVISPQRDWLRGDTIVARFDTAAAGDTASRPALQALVASGDASSFYQVPNSEGVRESPGVNYVRGRQIVVDFKEREVQTVTVLDQASGVYLEALSDTVAARPAPRRPGRPGQQPIRRPPTGVQRP